MAQVAYSSVTCTPHFKQDADKPWVTRESQVLVHFWFNPDRTQTLLQVAESIEAWAQNDYQQQLQQAPLACCAGSYSIIINNMEIRGTTYDRQAFATLYTINILHNEEPFTMRVRASVVGCNIL